MENTVKIRANRIVVNNVYSENEKMTAEVEGVVLNPDDLHKMLVKPDGYVGCGAIYSDVIISNRFTYGVPEIEEVMHENRATIIKWADGTKTVVACGNGETYDPYTGFMAAVVKKMFGGTGVAKSVHEAKNLKELEAKARAAEEKAKKEAEEAKAEYERKNAAKIAKRKAKAEKRLIARMAEEIRIEMLAKEQAKAMIKSERDKSA